MIVDIVDIDIKKLSLNIYGVNRKYIVFSLDPGLRVSQCFQHTRKIFFIPVIFLSSLEG